MPAPLQRHDVRSADGVRLAAWEGGVPGGGEILFIHGFCQCSLAWQRQFAAPELAGRFRLAAFDLRGHGASDKPADAAAYADDARFAGDVRAVIDTLGLERPVLVGWSYAGRVIGDYLAACGTGRLAGINYVCARTSNDPAFDGPGTGHLAGMQSDDPATLIAATRAFLRACYELQPSADEFETALAYNMLVPAPIRTALRSRPPSDGSILAGLDLPVLVTQGSHDQLVLQSLGEWTAARVPGSRLSLYEGIGHAPFVEDTARFNAELAAFTVACGNRPGR